MTDIEQDTQIIPRDELPDRWPDAEGNGHGSPSSAFEALRAKRAEHTAGQTYDLDVPGYGDMLVLRCGPLAGSQFSRFRERHERSRSPDRDFNLNADVLLAACREVLWRETPDGEAESFPDDEPMELDARLAEGLGLTATSGRELVRQLFGAAPIPELSLSNTMNGYMEWATALNAEADEAFAGESPAAPR